MTVFDRDLPRLTAAVHYAPNRLEMLKSGWARNCSVMNLVARTFPPMIGSFYTREASKIRSMLLPFGPFL